MSLLCLIANLQLYLNPYILYLNIMEDIKLTLKTHDIKYMEAFQKRINLFSRSEVMRLNTDTIIFCSLSVGVDCTGSKTCAERYDFSFIIR